ncbi:LysR family transcriptional regulator [Burkholderia pseudomultivorans]|uniref:LysR family transcriptional regulator n=1 Tax=Burkholderia pseudomultivorans TaxID=1207504 RepID=UPI0018C6A4C7|nr:LysR family transcriptional regulator [Burkholderia pseudomultivorans]
MKKPSSPKINQLVLMDTFARIVETGSFTEAAKQLNSSQPTVSRQLRILESHLGVRLIDRTTHGMAVTEIGRRYYEHVRHLINDLMNLENVVRSENNVAHGVLRVSVPSGFEKNIIARISTQYLKACPKVTLEWQTNEGSIKFYENAIDCAISTAHPNNFNAAFETVGYTKRFIVATPKAIEQRPEKFVHSDDIHEHPWVACSPHYRDEIELFGADGKVIDIKIKPICTVDHPIAAKKLVESNVGIALIPELTTRDSLANGELIRVFSDFEGCPIPLSISYKRENCNHTKIKEFISISREIIQDIISHEI